MRRLVIRPGGIGDVIVSLPALECLKTDYLEVWTTSRSVPLVRFAESVRSIASTGIGLIGVTEPDERLIAELGTFDSIVSWYGTNRPEFREAVATLPFTFLPALPPEGCGMHATDFYLAQVGGKPGAISRIPCEVGKEDYAVIHPFSGSRRKNWPLEKFQALAARLPMPVRWCAGEDDPQLPESIHIPDLYELACFLAKARLYVGNDSGITHLAAAVGTPTLAIFGPTEPDVWAPRGHHVRVVKANMKVKV